MNSYSPVISLEDASEEGLSEDERGVKFFFEDESIEGGDGGRWSEVLSFHSPMFL